MCCTHTAIPCVVVVNDYWRILYNERHESLVGIFYWFIPVAIHAQYCNHFLGRVGSINGIV